MIHSHRSRRDFLGSTTAAVAAGLGLSAWPLRADAGGPLPSSPIKIGACVLGLDQARAAGVEGVEVPVRVEGDALSLADASARSALKEKSAETGVPVCSLMLADFNTYPLATDDRASRWLEQAIDAAADLRARVILVAFFSNGDLLGPDGRVKKDELDSAIAKLKAAAPRAADRGVILGVENYLDGKANAELLDRVGHPAVQLYYDCYNTGVTKGHDVPADIRLLGPRIAQFHFKEGPKYLDRARHEPIAGAIRDIGYRGWVVLETSSPSKDVVADTARNAAIVRELFG
jgi:sugar phosphate isomerase/epimerase